MPGQRTAQRAGDVSKRLLDVTLSGLALVLLSPVLLVASLGVLVVLGRPVLFKQVRPGLNGEPFVLLKLRSMRQGPAEHHPVADAKRLGAFGRFLRSTSVDELPALWNVLRGQMSIVGPRPLLVEYLPLYTAEQFRRHEVRPGLTGLAQVRGRNELDWEKRLALDVWYVDNRSLWLDLKIIAKTALVVLKREGIPNPEPFRGTRPAGSD